ncbi:hypothetical protein B566_EDAN006134 [Ephemera danica]|nr:hypothetical protein B566_EDAN006134 [Ephemera danica]
MLSLVVALSALAAVSGTSLQNVTIYCKDVKSILVTPEQLDGKWTGFEIYRGMESIAEAIAEMCNTLDIKKIGPSKIEISTKVYYQEQIISKNVTELVAEDQNFSVLTVSMNAEQYMTEVVCDNPPDASKSKVLYLLTNRRLGVTLSNKTIAKLRGDLQSALKLQDIELIMPYGNYCKN